MSNCVRVLQVIGSLNSGGSQSMVMNIYRNIDRNKVQFDFIVDTPDEDYYADEIKKLGGRIYEMPKLKGKNLSEVVHAWNIFFKSHTEYKVLHSHVRSYAVIYIKIAKKYGLTTLIHSHSTSNGTGIQSMVKSVLQYPLRYTADYLLACSQEAGIWLYGARTCTKPNYIFFPNAIDVSAYLPNGNVREKYRKSFGVNGKLVIGHVGRFMDAKNHMFLVDVFKKVHDRNSDTVLVLVGDGDLKVQVENKVKELCLEDSVIFTGSRSDVSDMLQMMDVFAFPSLWEGLPVTLIEAQSAGLPCIISDKITHDIDLSERICRLPINSADLWCDSILKAGDKKDVSENIIAAGFDINDTAPKIENLYVKLSLGE